MLVRSTGLAHTRSTLVVPGIARHHSKDYSRCLCMMATTSRHILTLLFLILCSSSKAGEVVKLNNENFEHQTQASTGQTTGKWFVLFGAVWCGYSCTKLTPVLKELADLDNIVTGKVDTTANEELGDRFGIEAHPTLLFFADRKLFKYTGETTLDAMKEFVMGEYKKTTGLPVPGPPSYFALKWKQFLQALNDNDEIRYLKEDFKHIMELRKNAAVALIMIGIVFGFCSGCVACKVSARKNTKTS